MKYRVVGWASYDDPELEDAEYNSSAAVMAIIDDIKTHGYDFTGYEHQEYRDCAPVLNDGKRRTFSQRGWGGIMARAHGYFGAYDYSSFAFSIGETSKSKRPEDREFDPDSFIPETDLAETFTVEIPLHELLMLEFSDTVFIDGTDAVRYLDEGDTLILTAGKEKKAFTVKELERSWEDGKDTAYLPIKLTLEKK